MKNKISILTIAIILTVILFLISTYLQRKLINYEPTMKCYVAIQDIEEYEKMSPEKMQEVDIPIQVTMNMRVVQDPEDVDGLYASSKIYSGQILVKNQFASKEKLSIYEGELGKEKIAIKIKNAENGVSYGIREKSIINVYATLRTEYSNNVFPEANRQFIGSETDGFCVIKVLENVKVIGVFDSQGYEVEKDNQDSMPDTVMVCVMPSEARDINLIRDIATFNITELERNDTVENSSS